MLSSPNNANRRNEKGSVSRPNVRSSASCTCTAGTATARRTAGAGPRNSRCSAAAGTDSSATDQPSPNGTKTPQQIFEQLQKMRQQPAQSDPQ